MGKRGGKKGGRGRGRGGWGRGDGGPPRRAERPQKQAIERCNIQFEKYYNELEVVPEPERDAFWAAMRRDLPNSFRFTGSKAHALAVQEKLKNFYIPEITSIQHEGEFVEAPKPVEWFPDQLAWYMTVPKNVIRRFPPFASFQKFLVAETDVGNISRQEVVSMIPPLLLDVKPGMTVLDLCAAPGSKSAQLIELVHAGEEDRTREVAEKARKGLDVPSGPEWEDDGRATGLLIANDVDYKRAHMLVHQMKRLSSPNIVVTNHDATLFPSIKLPSKRGPNGETTVSKYLKFDRILADVPCTGDGTARKNIEIWKGWTPQNALGLHLTQIRILVRALQMLKVGGRVVYSTCSMNPVEDEAVVTAAIDRCGGPTKVEIKECADALPGLKRYPGFQQWKVMDRQGRTWNTFHEVEAHRNAEGVSGLGRLNESMFAPEGEMAGIGLNKCMRLYPHMHDTGAFFIAVLEKKSEIRALRQENEYRKVETTEASMQKSQNMTSPPSNADVSLAKEQVSTGHPEASNEQSNLLNGHGTLDKEHYNSNTKVSEARGEPYLQRSDETSEEPVVEGSQIEPLDTLKRKAEDEVETQHPAKQTKLSSEHDPVETHPVDKSQLLPHKNIDQDGPVQADVQAHLNEPNRTDDGKLTSSADTLGTSQHFQASANLADLDAEINGQSTVHAGKQKGKHVFEEPFKYLLPNMPELESIRQFYNVSPRFPQDRFMVRNAMGSATRNVYYTASLAKSILQENEGKGMKFVHAGVKMFVKQDVPRPEMCPWRIQTDGMPIMEAWVGEQRVVRLRNRKTLRKLLVEMFPTFEGDKGKELAEVLEQVNDIQPGCCVLRVEPGEGDDSISERMVFPLWKSIKSLNLMLPKEDRRALLLRLFNDSTPLINQSLDKDRTTAEIPQKANTSSPELEVASGKGEIAKQAEANLLDVIEDELDKPDGGAALEEVQKGEDVPFDPSPITENIQEIPNTDNR